MAKLSLDREIVIGRYGKAVWRMRRMPAHAGIWLSGVFLPPHERLWTSLYFAEYKEQNTLAGRGSSKCLALGTNVLMFDGSTKKVEEIVEGDLVMGRDSTPRTVLGTNRGSGPMYKVRQTSGIDYVVNDAHLLVLQKSKKTRAVKNSTIYSKWPGNEAIINVKDFAALTPYGQEHLRGFKVPTAYPEQAVPLDPYFLGMWLGDGTACRPSITTMEPEVVDFLESFADSWGANLRVHPLKNNRASEYSLTYGNQGKRKNPNPILTILRNLGLTCPMKSKGIGSSNKHIPLSYLANSEEVRLQVLAGLLDADGTLTSGTFCIGQKYERLARDIKRLADSLGFRTSIYARDAKFKGKLYPYYEVTISGDIWKIPTKIPRKRVRETDLRKNKDWRLSQVSVEFVGDGEWAGFHVDRDHQFLLEDGTVTHNTWTHGSFCPVIYGVLYRDVGGLTLSNSGFRGGKLLFADSERLVLGQLKSQRLPGNYLLRCIDSTKVIKRDPSMWQIRFKSNSGNATAPTNNPEQLRGIRATKINLDERGFMDDEISKQIVRPMMSVGGSMRETATAAAKNQLHQFSTIDVSLRPWWAELVAAQSLAHKEYLAQKARKEGNWEEYDRLMQEDENRLDTASFSYTRVDYTDLIIPEHINTLDGEQRFRVNYPLEPGQTIDQIMKFDRNERRNLIFTYPVDKDSIEEPLRSGTSDPEIFGAENRNIPISASGNVFPFDLIQKISEMPVWKPSKAQMEEGMEPYYAPLMYTCGDPCILGIDVARESDETTFVIIRIGEMANGDFKPFSHRVDKKGRQILGQTPWNHICWAEAHQKLQADDGARIIRDLYERYNIIHTDEIGGIAMDKRGGGGAIRDALGNPKPDVIDGVVQEFKWDDAIKFYDPEDETFGHYQHRDDPKTFVGNLRLLATTNGDNLDWTMGMRALMQQNKLKLAYWLPASKWAKELGLIMPNGDPDRNDPEYQKLLRGYNGIQKLKMQLIRLQRKTSENGIVRFLMPGDRQKEEGKKDLWAASIYAYGLLRQHLQQDTKEDDSPPVTEPIVFDFSARLFR